jgi:AcrR family transcriptional regulator
MTRPRTVTDQAILAAARHCAVERGPAVSLDAIAQRVGLSSPALLKRFGSRQELMIAALRPSDPPQWVRDLEAGPDERPLEQQLHALIAQVFDFFASEMPCMTALSESGFPLDEIFDRKQTPGPIRSIWALSSWLERAQQRGLVDADVSPDGDFEGIATGLLGALHGRVFMSDFIGKSFWRRSRDEYVSDLARVYARALAPSRAVHQIKAPKPAPRSGKSVPKLVPKRKPS